MWEQKGENSGRSTCGGQCPEWASLAKGSHLNGSRGYFALQGYELLVYTVRSPRPWQRAPSPLGLLQQPWIWRSGDPSWKCRLQRSSCISLHDGVKWGRGSPSVSSPQTLMVGPRPLYVAKLGFSLGSIGGKPHVPNLHPQFCREPPQRGPQALVPGTVQAACDAFPPGHQTTPGGTSGLHVQVTGTRHSAARWAQSEHWICSAGCFQKPREATGPSLLPSSAPPGEDLRVF